MPTFDQPERACNIEYNRELIMYIETVPIPRGKKNCQIRSIYTYKMAMIQTAKRFFHFNFIFLHRVAVRPFPNFSRTFYSSIKWQNFFTAANCVRYVWRSCIYSNKKIFTTIFPRIFFPRFLLSFSLSLSPFYSFHIISDIDELHYVCKKSFEIYL